MATVKQGEAVVIAAREATPQDVKSGLYYAHYAGLRGTVLKLYGEEASVNVDRDSLPADIRARHEEGEQAMRQKWLDGLSEEARNRLGETGKRFGLNYTVLVSINDLAAAKGGASSPAAKPSAADKRAAKAVAQAAQSLDPAAGESDVEQARPSADGASQSGTDSSAKRLSASDLDSKEAEFLRQRAASGPDGAAKKTRGK
jgi:hypothetical protein